MNIYESCKYWQRQGASWSNSRKHQQRCHVLIWLQMWLPSEWIVKFIWPLSWLRFCSNRVHYQLLLLLLLFFICGISLSPMCAYIYSHVVVTDECDVFLVFVRRKHTFLNSTIYSEVLVLSDKQLLRELDVSQHLSSTRFFAVLY